MRICFENWVSKVFWLFINILVIFGGRRNFEMYG